MSSNFYIKGVKDALGVPVIGLGLSMFTFGAYLNASGFNLLQSFLSTFFAFALPGQFVMAETLLSGGNLFNVFLAVLFTNARLFPMTMHVIPTLKYKKMHNWRLFLLCHFIAVTAWINYIAIYKKINLNNRSNYFFGLGGFLWISSVIFTILGFIFSSMVSYELLTALVFFNPMYFLIMTVRNLITKELIIVFFLSVIFTPFMIHYFNDWGVIISGLLSGTLVFIFHRKN
ncbi:AzlC family ABC transporter permease [Alphaproteobacteria bacterium]|nr:AzlC family ABC transporter permease [Alphaproteobacteria bacterium]